MAPLWIYWQDRVDYKPAMYSQRDCFHWNTKNHGIVAVRTRGNQNTVIVITSLTWDPNLLSLPMAQEVPLTSGPLLAWAALQTDHLQPCFVLPGLHGWSLSFCCSLASSLVFCCFLTCLPGQTLDLPYHLILSQDRWFCHQHCLSWLLWDCTVASESCRCLCWGHPWLLAYLPWWSIPILAAPCLFPVSLHAAVSQSNIPAHAACSSSALEEVRSG